MADALNLGSSRFYTPSLCLSYEPMVVQPYRNELRDPFVLTQMS